MPNTKLKWKTLDSIHLKCILDSISGMSFKGEDSLFIAQLLEAISEEYNRLIEKEGKDGS